MTDVPDWFVDEYTAAARAALPATVQAGLLWKALEARGWESFRLLGGERLEDGALSKPQKVPTLVLPRVAIVERPTTFTQITGLG